MVVDRLKVLAQRREGARPGARIAQHRAAQRRLGVPPARFGMPAMPPKAIARLRDRAVLADREAEGAHHRRDVLVEALGHLVAAEDMAGLELGDRRGW